ncbi:MAG: T9SS type A sorting domain-containing protein [Ferruginibacter sp.]
MKQIYISVLLLFIKQQVICQSWVPLGSDEQTSSSIIMTAASRFFAGLSNDAVPYVSYLDDAGGGANIGDFKVHARRFKNNQWEFAGNGISPQFPGSDDLPIAFDGDIPYVAYSEPDLPLNLQNKLSVRKLNSNTGNWDLVGPQGLTEGPATSIVIATDNGKIYVAYSDGAHDSKITVKRFDNANPANGWQTIGLPGFSNAFILRINLVIDNGIPYVAYLDFGTATNMVLVKKFNGTAWVDVGTNNATGGLQVFVQSLKFNSDHTPFLLFINNNGEGILRNLNTANTWVTTGDQPFATSVTTTASLAILHDIPFVVFGKRVNQVIQLHAKSFNAAINSWADVGTQPLTASPCDINEAVLTTDGNNKLFLFFHNFCAGIYAKTFDASAILPLTITAFNVTREQNTSVLQWDTENGLNNKMFEVEHSTDGLHFTKIGEVAAQLPGNISQHYRFVHTGPVTGINFYRLKQIDNNDQFIYSEIISITFSKDQQLAITLSPNPVKDILHVEHFIEGKTKITISDAAGKTIKRSESSDRSIDINVAGLAHGTYFISIYGDKAVGTGSFVK